MIEKYFEDINEKKVEIFFDDFINIEGIKTFIDWYNRTVLDKKKFTFKDFNYQWRLRMSVRYYSFFGENYFKIINEIQKEKNITQFYDRYCNPDKDRAIAIKHQPSFCSKLFHTVLPSEFPPVDSHIREKLGYNLNHRITMKEVLEIKKEYKLFNDKQRDKIELIKNVLKRKFPIFRAGELSYIRIIDMYLWTPSFKNSKL